MSSTDKIRAALIATLSYEERETILAQLAEWFQNRSTLEEDEFDEMLQSARAETVLRQQEEEAKWAELRKAESSDADRTEMATAEGPSVDPEWEKHHEAAMRFGIRWGGDDDPRQRCLSHVLVRGESHRCDGANGHFGWAHWNADLGMMWQ